MSGVGVIEAKLNRDYALRMAGVGCLMVAICLWSLYDGALAWPRLNARIDAVRPALQGANLTANAWLKRDGAGATPLDKVFADQKIKPPAKLIKKLDQLSIPSSSGPSSDFSQKQLDRVRELFGNPLYNNHDLQGQYLQAALTLLLGVLALVSVGLKARQRYYADDKGLAGSGFGGDPIPYAQIAAIEWSRWSTKGIAILKLRDGRRIKLDGWHFVNISGIVERIKTHRPDLCAHVENSVVTNTTEHSVE